MSMGASSTGHIGVFDSGVGGISVLRQLVRTLPCEDFLYYGDSANAPYGEKESDWVFRRSREIVDDLVRGGAKAIVIACNTATSAAAAALRERYADVPIVGVEPALKPATLMTETGRILVMATPVTLKLDKYQQLAQRWGSNHEIVSVPCPGLAARIEQGNLGADDVRDMLVRFLGPYAGAVDCVVLGCTHYPFVADQIRDVMGDVVLLDGALGTAQQLDRRLAEHNLLTESSESGEVVFQTSSEHPGEIELYRRFFSL